MIEKCAICGNASMYAEEWDASYCKECNLWLEKTCGITEEEFIRNPWDCRFQCFKRPEKPNK